MDQDNLNIKDTRTKEIPLVTGIGCLSDIAIKVIEGPFSDREHRKLTGNEENQTKKTELAII